MTTTQNPSGDTETRIPWEAFVEYADETNVALYGLPPGVDFSPATLNKKGQTAVCYAAFIGKKGVARAIAKIHGWCDDEVDHHGFNASDYMESTNPAELVRRTGRDRDMISLLVESETGDCVTQSPVGIKKRHPLDAD